MVFSLRFQRKQLQTSPAAARGSHRKVSTIEEMACEDIIASFYTPFFVARRPYRYSHCDKARQVVIYKTFFSLICLIIITAG